MQFAVYGVMALLAVTVMISISVISKLCSKVIDMESKMKQILDSRAEHMAFVAHKIKHMDQTMDRIRIEMATITGGELLCQKRLKDFDQE